MLSELGVMRAMHPGVLACAPDAPIGRVAELMAAYGVHSVVVFHHDPDGNEAAWGIVSDLDLVAALLDGVGDDATASSIAASPVVLVSTDDTLEHAAERMVAHGTAHLVVLDADTSHPIGILSTLDVAAAVAELPVRSGPPRRRRRMTV
jgi:CBS domain-containing protein